MDWVQIAALYAALVRHQPTRSSSSTVAVAVAMADGPAAGLAIVDRLAASGTLDDYPYLHAARADLLRRLERWSEATAAYRRAAGLTTNGAERAFLERRLVELADRHERSAGGRPH